MCMTGKMRITFVGLVCMLNGNIEINITKMFCGSGTTEHFIKVEWIN